MRMEVSRLIRMEVAVDEEGEEEFEDDAVGE